MHNPSQWPGPSTQTQGSCSLDSLGTMKGLHGNSSGSQIMVILLLGVLLSAAGGVGSSGLAQATPGAAECLKAKFGSGKLQDRSVFSQVRRRAGLIRGMVATAVPVMLACSSWLDAQAPPPTQQPPVPNMTFEPNLCRWERMASLRPSSTAVSWVRKATCRACVHREQGPGYMAALQNCV